MTKPEHIARLTDRCMALYTYAMRERSLGDIGRGHAHLALQQAQAIARTLQQLTPTAKDSSHGPR